MSVGRILALDNCKDRRLLHVGELRNTKSIKLTIICTRFAGFAYTKCQESLKISVVVDSSRKCTWRVFHVNFSNLPANLAQNAKPYSSRLEGWSCASQDWIDKHIQRDEKEESKFGRSDRPQCSIHWWHLWHRYYRDSTHCRWHFSHSPASKLYKPLWSHKKKIV